MSSSSCAQTRNAEHQPRRAELVSIPFDSPTPAAIPVTTRTPTPTSPPLTKRETFLLEALVDFVFEAYITGKLIIPALDFSNAFWGYHGELNPDRGVKGVSRAADMGRSLLKCLLGQVAVGAARSLAERDANRLTILEGTLLHPEFLAILGPHIFAKMIAAPYVVIGDDTHLLALLGSYAECVGDDELLEFCKALLPQFIRRMHEAVEDYEDIRAATQREADRIAKERRRERHCQRKAADKLLQAAMQPIPDATGSSTQKTGVAMVSSHASHGLTIAAGKTGKGSRVKEGGVTKRKWKGKGKGKGKAEQ